MSFLGNIAAAQTAKRIAKYNASVNKQQANFLKAKSEVNEAFYENVTLPLLKKRQAKTTSELEVSILRSGAENRIGTTTYDVMLQNQYNEAFNLILADYNKDMDKMDQINQSLLMEAKATGQIYQGDLTARSNYFAAVGSLLSDANTFDIV
jgi:hypothetical protein